MTNTHTDWTELTTDTFQDWFPAPASLTASLSEPDARACRTAYARHCMRAAQMVADTNGHCPHDVTQCIADTVAGVMSELIASGEMRGKLH